MKNGNISENGLHTENMAVGYDRSILIDGIDIAVNPGEILTLIGPNGSGKSTVLRSIIGQLKLIKGIVFFGDTDRKDIDRNELAKKLSVLMTDRVKTELMTCFDVVATARYPYTGRFGILSDHDRQAVTDALATVGASDLADRDFNNISDGQRQRIMLARCIAQEPEIIVLDEPLSYLDIKYKLEFIRILKDLCRDRNVAVIMSVHEIELAGQISDRVVCIGKNGIDRVGTRDEIFTADYICRLFDISKEDYLKLYPSSFTDGEKSGGGKADTIETGYVAKGGRLLRKGITTGTCAAAAAYAAATCLLNGEIPEEVSVHTPSGETVSVPVYADDSSEDPSFYVIKDSGDDPDVTNGVRVYASIGRLKEVSDADVSEGSAGIFTDEDHPGICLAGGEGVGTVTKEGLEQPVGYPAINKVPRAMIFKAVDSVRAKYDPQCPLMVTVSVEGGAGLAAKTFNPELGIEGGISILGTGGILEPMSDKAIVDTIETSIKQQTATGHKALLVTPGQYGQGYVKNELKIETEGSVKCSNFIGEAIDLAGVYGCTNVLLVGNLGKLVKLAAGIMNTHSAVADGRMDIMCAHLALCGGSRDMVTKMYECINTDTALDKLKQWGLYEDVINSLIAAIDKRIKKRAGDRLNAGVMLFSEKYGYLGETSGAAQALKAYISENDKKEI